MSSENSLLADVGKRLHIIRDPDESKSEWEQRVIYSAIGRLAAASLYDSLEEDEPISVSHYKKRVIEQFYAYKMLYPEADFKFSDDGSALADYMYDVMSKEGVFYHTPRRLVPARYREANLNDICFARGENPGEKLKCSGLGVYKKATAYTDDIVPVCQMFGISSENVNDMFESAKKHAKWSSFTPRDNIVNYLQVRSYKKGYWGPQSDKAKSVSMLRIGEKGMEQYYLYRMQDDEMQISPLPAWMTKEAQYLSISTGILYENNTLPAIEITTSKEVVSVKLNYLLPVPEYNFLLLYSWPKRYDDKFSPFERVMGIDVFSAFKTVMSEKGYFFKEQ